MKYDRSGKGNEDGIKEATASVDKVKQKIYMIRPSMVKNVKQIALDSKISESEFVRRALDVYLNIQKREELDL